MMQKNRDLSFDVFRGVAIIAVVAIHAAYMEFSSDTVLNWQLVAYCQLLTFSVPAFLFISGYWISTKPIIESWEDYRTFLIKRLSRVLVPYFFWSIVLLWYVAIRDNKFDMYQIIFKLMTGRAAFPYYPYYFIIVIAQLYIITPILQNINRKSYGLISIIILNVLGLLVLYFSRLKLIGHHPITLPFYLWIIFYEIGLLVGRRTSEVFPPKKIRSLILPGLLISILFSEIEGLTILSKVNDPFFASAITKYSSFLYSVFVILCFLVFKERISRWPELLVTLGRYSFGIYLIHTPVLNQVAYLVRKSSAIHSFQSLYQLTVVLITISICFVMINVTRKLLPESFCGKVLGF
jgi:probable poly-beta-1,6-N-acetyl-D-glucosamine export protein